MGFYQNTRKPVGFGGTIMVRLMNVCHNPIATWGFSKLSMRDNLNILDIGCGGGKNIATWLRKSKNSHVTGLDYSEVSVAESSKKNKWAIKRNRCEILRGNVAEMPFSDNTFDCVSAFETIYFWPGLEECFTEVDVYKRQALRSFFVYSSFGFSKTSLTVPFSIILPSFITATLVHTA